MHPRRRPRQARAQATVEAIVQATARVLVEDGYDRASTNRIAQAAGVSIGSLYQYFPSKEALVAALVDEHTSRMMEVVSRKLGLVESRDLSVNMRELMEGMIAAYRVNPTLHRVLCQEVPKVGDLRRVYDFEEKLAKRIRVQLHELRDDIRHRDLDRAVFLLINAIPSIIRAAIETDAAGEKDALLAQELTDLSLRYLMYTPASESGSYRIQASA